jgi:acetyl esterase
MMAPKATHELDIKDVEYLRDGALTLQARIYQPKGAGPFPTVLYLHGGAWTSNDRTTNPAMPKAVAEGGNLIVSIDFRQGGDHPFPSSIIDINYAARWLKVHARDFNGNPDSIGGMGSSSGGHLIVLAGMRPRDPRYTVRPFAEAQGVDASLAYVIPCSGVLDPYARYLGAKAQGKDDLVARHDAYFLTAEAQEDSSPVLMLKRGERVELPPALVVQGTADEWVPKEMAEGFVAAYNAAGGKAELSAGLGMPHAMWEWSDDEFTKAVERIRGFITRHVTAGAAAD